MRISDWSSDVCSSDLYVGDVLCTYADILRVGRTSIAIHIEAWALRSRQGERVKVTEGTFTLVAIDDAGRPRPVPPENPAALRSEEHTSELQSLMRRSYAVFCLKKKKNTQHKQTTSTQHSITNNT